jgi:hypothetical protein
MGCYRVELTSVLIRRLTKDGGLGQTNYFEEEEGAFVCRTQQ